MKDLNGIKEYSKTFIQFLEGLDTDKKIQLEKIKTEHGDGYKGKFSHETKNGDQEYHIQAKPEPNILGADIPEFYNKKIAEISFSLKDAPLGQVFYTQKNNKSTLGASISIYGAVLTEFIKIFKMYDILFCALNAEHSRTNKEIQQKYGIYKMMLRAGKNKISDKTYYYETTYGREIVMIISKIPLTETTQKQYSMTHTLIETTLHNNE